MLQLLHQLKGILKINNWRIKMIEINGTKNQQSIHEHIQWLYPEIYDNKNLSSITISLSHTRAASDIRIKYDSDRDGWIIERSLCDPDNYDASDMQQVAFIEAWKN